jgi:rhodanese-related sulfurtransferase
VTERVAVPEISVDTLEQYLKDGVPLIDVRQLDEYTDAHVAGARLVPLDDLPERIDEVPTDTPVYLICAVGGRSARASEWLLAQGVDATNVAGGTKAWIEAGKPTVSGEEPG